MHRRPQACLERPSSHRIHASNRSLLAYAEIRPIGARQLHENESRFGKSSEKLDDVVRFGALVLSLMVMTPFRRMRQCSKLEMVRTESRRQGGD